jgi:thiol-disulfide isomerase/thioredoxin
MLPVICDGQGRAYVLSGNIEGGGTKCIYLTIPGRAQGIIADSAEVRDGEFEFRGEIPYVMKAFLSEAPLDLLSGDRNVLSFYLDPGESRIEAISGSLPNAVISGSESNGIMAGLTDGVAHIAANRSSVLSAYILEGLRAGTAEKEELYRVLSPEVRESLPGLRVREQIEFPRRGLPGSVAADFASPAITGDTLRLSDFRGKYVLLDFWGSWCKPCRAGHPHLLELYNKYKACGFEIIGIADDDRNPDAWRKAIEHDGIGEWKHILRGLDMTRFARGDTDYLDYPLEISASRYGISAYPTKILIDPSGMIIGRYGGDPAPLEAKLEELFE